jgi:hypothetical protein
MPESWFCDVIAKAAVCGQIRPMRHLLVVVSLLLATPALAQFWGHYDNTRFAYGIDVPPGFVGNGESDNGDGQIFHRLEAEQSLTVWGGILMESFEQEVADRQGYRTAENWGITYQASSPQWASFSGQRDHRIFYTRMIALCDGASYAAFTLEYNIRDLSKTDAVVEGLVRSFVAEGC